MDRQFLDAPDGHKIETFVWPNLEGKAWIHILHGMAEHAERYDEFAQALVSAGFSVVAHNHRGHGNLKPKELGLFAEKDGWEKVLNDVDQVRKTITDDKPYFLLGHSMGSFIAQSYMTTQPDDINGMILSGTNLHPSGILKSGQVVAKIERFRLGPLKKSKLLHFLSFDSFNNAFKPIRTEFDWLSRDEELVDKTIDDPRCGFVCTIQLWLDLFSGLIKLYAEKGYKTIQPDLPIYIFGGDQDPVGMKGKGLDFLAKAYKKAGQNEVSLTIYKDGRHEMLNELNKKEVYQDTIAWINNHL